MGDFGSMMEQMGVAPLANQPQPTPKKKKRQARQESPTEALTEPLQLSAEAPDTAVVEPVPVASAPVDSEAIQALRGALRSAEGRMLEAEGRAKDLGRQLEVANAALKELAARLQQAEDRLVPPDEQPTVSEVLTALGVVDKETSVHAITTLAANPDWGEVMLSLRSGPSQTRRFTQGLGVWCGNPRCAPPQFTVPVRVPAEHCPTCGGVEVDVALRRFADAAQLAGVRRIAIVGGDTRLRSQLRSGLDTRLELRLVCPDTVRAVVQAEADCRWAQVIVCWGTKAQTLEGYRSEAPRFIKVGTIALTGMLMEAAAGIDNLEGNQIPPVG